jgi:hypothetical protein
LGPLGNRGGLICAAMFMPRACSGAGAVSSGGHPDFRYRVLPTP